MNDRQILTPQKQPGSLWRLLLKLAISVVLVYLLLRGRDLETLGRQMLAIDRGPLLLAVICYALVCIPSAARWSIVVASMGHKLRFLKALQIILIGYFFNLTLISSIGGDGVRMWEAHRAGLPVEVAVKSVVIERLLQFLAHLLLVVAAFPVLYVRAADGPIQLVAALILAASAVCIAALLMFDRMPASLTRYKIFKSLFGFSADLRNILFVPGRGLATVALGLINQVTILLVVALLAKGLRLPIDFFDCLIVVPIATLVTALPISIAGWGVRETAFVVGFGLLALPAGDALLLSALFGLLTTVVRLPGGPIWLLTRRNGAAA
jgi:hypothetical protein